MFFFGWQQRALLFSARRGRQGVPGFEFGLVCPFIFLLLHLIDHDP